MYRKRPLSWLFEAKIRANGLSRSGSAIIALAGSAWHAGLSSTVKWGRIHFSLPTGIGLKHIYTRAASSPAASDPLRFRQISQTAESHYPRFVQEIEESGGHLPKFVRQEFEDYLKCGLLEHGFLPVKFDGCRHEHLNAASWNSCAATLPDHRQGELMRSIKRRCPGVLPPNASRSMSMAGWCTATNGRSGMARRR